MAEKTQGEIMCEMAYAQGKMLNNSGWYGVLPRNITPSDIDMVIDNNGDCLFCEISRHNNEWTQLGPGQLWLYKNMIDFSRSIAVLWKHSVPQDEQIDTFTMCDSFQVMYGGQGEGFHLTKQFKGGRWVDFVKAWFNDPRIVLNKLPNLKKLSLETPSDPNFISWEDSNL